MSRSGPQEHSNFPQEETSTGNSRFSNRKNQSLPPPSSSNTQSKQVERSAEPQSVSSSSNILRRDQSRQSLPTPDKSEDFFRFDDHKISKSDSSGAAEEDILLRLNIKRISEEGPLVAAIPYPFANDDSTLSDFQAEKSSRSIVLTNIRADISESEVSDTLSTHGKIEKVFIFSRNARPFAVVRFQSKDSVHRFFMANLHSNNKRFALKHSQQAIESAFEDEPNLSKLILEQISDPKNFAKLLLQKGDLEDILNGVVFGSPLANFAHTIRVREVILFNLPSWVNEFGLRKHLGVFGPIVKVSFIRSQTLSAFVKYSHAKSAEDCLANKESLREIFEHPIRIFIADHLRRMNIVGDDKDTWNDESELTNVVFLGFRFGADLPSASKIIEGLPSQSKILNFLHRPTQFQHLRPFVLLEFQNQEFAKDFVMELDKDGGKFKEFLGASHLEANVLVKPNLPGGIAQHMPWRFRGCRGAQARFLEHLAAGETRRWREVEPEQGEGPFWAGFLRLGKLSHFAVDAFSLAGHDNDFLEAQQATLDGVSLVPIGRLEGLRPVGACVLRGNGGSESASLLLATGKLAKLSCAARLKGAAKFVLLIVPACPETRLVFPGAGIGQEELLLIAFENSERVWSALGKPLGGK